YALYAQDDFKVTPNLTLNLGVRYSVPTPLTEAFNRQSSLNLTLPNAAVDGAPGALEFWGYGADSCHCKSPLQVHYRNIAPRIGFAYKLGNKTVLRGSYGIFYQNAGALGGVSGIGASAVGYTAYPNFPTLDSGVHPGFYWDSGFPAYTHPPFFNPTLGTGFNTTTPSGSPGFYADPYLSGIPPRTEDWNLTIERQLSPSTVVKASYQGSSGHFLPTGVGNGPDSNQLNPAYLQLGGLLTQPYSPSTLAAAQAIMPGIKLPYANFAGTIAQMLLPYPQYAGFSQNWGPGEAFGDIGNSDYEAFQLAIQRHMSHGLELLFSYTVSKLLDDAGSNLSGYAGASGRTGYENRLEYSPGIADVPQQLALTYVYHLPAGQGHRLGGSNAVSRALLSGWRFAGIQQYSEGTPLGPAGANCGPAISEYTGGCYADYTPGFTGPVKINGSYGTGNLFGATPPDYFNINAFSEPGTFSFGDSPRTDPYRLRNTTWLNENFALMRDIKLRENLTLQFAGQVFNAFNRTQFSAPSLAINSAAYGEVSGQSNTPREFQFNAKLVF
ncbi:MAG TPA: TonB-dependent receptor, partial [Terriglobia bacterium]|nr:TonB-dependent receptor [Terriglobia bacterium]